MNTFHRVAITLIPFLWIATGVVLLDRGDVLGSLMAFMLVFHTVELLLLKTGATKVSETDV
jgi:multisubunit Na+/H+ antiporter MnhC subunit